MKYTSFLRLPRISIMDNESFSAVLSYLSEYDIKEVTFFDCFVHSVHKLSYYEDFAKEFLKKAPILRSNGIKVGINHLTTLGFFYQGGDVIERELPSKVSEDGNEQIGTICRSNPKCREYIKKTYSILANAHPDFLYVDDDINFNRDSVCYCQNCIERFEEETGTFKKYGLSANYENLTELINKEESVRNSYIDFNKELATEIYSLIETTVHKICPNIELGMMTYGGPFLKSEIEDWTYALKGENSTLRFRPGGGLYSDSSFDDLFKKISDVEIQNEYLPPFVDKIQAELECYSPSRAKSLHYLSFECLSYLATGCNGIAFSLLGAPSLSEKYNIEYKKRWSIIKSIDRFGEKMMNDIGDMPICGIYPFVENHCDGNYSTKWNKISSFEPYIHYAGLPVTYRSDNAFVNYVNGEIAKNLSDEAIYSVFKKPTYLTGDAAYILNQRGFERYTGCREIKCYTEDTKKMLDKEELFGIRFSKIDCELDNMQAFYHFPSYTVTVANKGESHAHLIDFSGNVLGPCTVSTVNEFGQKVVIDGYHKFLGADPFPQKLLLDYLFKSLSSDIDCSLSNGKITIFKRNESNKVAITVLNPSYDNEENIDIKINKPVLKVSEFIYFDNGEIKQIPIDFDKAKSNIRIPLLPYMSLGYFIYQTK